ncbi:hypothetical protein U9M48_032721 [Paspalum notatum var. saurae]|uniref:Uncharacterized protein n=1 Tax=Paspalum notatum var. saurae TaxID=547442 RepID=A0AAQ3U5R9_PASNO
MNESMIVTPLYMLIAWFLWLYHRQPPTVVGAASLPQLLDTARGAAGGRPPHGGSAWWRIEMRRRRCCRRRCRRRARTAEAAAAALGAAAAEIRTGSASPRTRTLPRFLNSAIDRSCCTPDRVEI